MKSIYRLNLLSRIIFLLITPVVFQLVAIGFIWHSIYWGVITMAVLIWLGFILLSPLFGRIGCGWFCFMGTTMDLAGSRPLIKMKYRRAPVWLRLMILVPFFASAGWFYVSNKAHGLTHDFAVEPFFLKATFDAHYKLVWMIDVGAAVVFGLLLERRWVCRNLCYMGVLCSAGARYSRLLPVVDTERCTRCGKCEKSCPVHLPVMQYISPGDGLVTHSECILCGKCVEDCKTGAIKIRFILSRRQYRRNLQLRNKAVTAATGVVQASGRSSG